MPVWFELIVMMLVAYALGIALGWFAWGQSPGQGENEPENNDKGGAQ